MLRRLRPRSAYDVMAAIAFFIAVVGGTAYAANTIRSEDIVNGEVKSADIGGNAVKTDELDSFAVGSGELATKGVTSSKLGDGSVGGRAAANDSLTGADLQESSLGKVPNANKLDGLDSTDFQKASAGAGTLVARTEDAALSPNGGDAFNISYCDSGERATGGGVLRIVQSGAGGNTVVQPGDWLKASGPYVQSTSNPPADGETPTGWISSLNYANDGGRTPPDIARFYAICAKP